MYLSSLKSSNNASTGCSSIQFEIHCNANNLALSENDCINNYLYVLRISKLGEETDIAVADYRMRSYGNIIFEHEIEEITR